MGQERFVGAVYDLWQLPKFDIAIVVVAVDLGQRERFPVNLDRLSGGIFYFRQPHGCVVDEGSTEIVKGGELGIGHSFTSQESLVRAPAPTHMGHSRDGPVRTIDVRVDCIHRPTRCQSMAGSLFGGFNRWQQARLYAWNASQPCYNLDSGSRS